VRPPDASRDPYSLTLRFCRDLCQELDYHKSSRKYVSMGEYKIFKAYYKELNFGTVEYIAHSMARLLKHVIHRILSHRRPLRILDAGCGFGSEVIFFSLLGGDVVGIDLESDRVSVAKKRLEYYKEKYDRAINPNFYVKNILTFSDGDNFDVVWSNQSVSHIHPIDNFLMSAWRNLRVGGSLIICDSNNINPYGAFHAWLAHRKGGLYTQVKDPETRECIPFARERLLNPLYFKSVLGSTHFDIRLVEYHGFMPPLFNTQRFFRYADEVLGKIPFVRLAGGTYVVSATKSLIRTPKAF
jgi:SAM-dependent methyltransferase